ncbi:MAG: DUF4349 domain-containing protein [Anaerolineales bacterium]|nr:DUF4349 domain-containing protein [Anaerolineales bacterium]
MKSQFKLIALFVLIGGLILSACGARASAPQMDYSMEAPAATEAPAMEGFAVAPEAVSESAAKGAPDTNSNVVMATAMPPSVDGAPAEISNAGHMIIKNADIKLLVEDTDVAIDRATQAVGDMGGYIVSTRVWYQPHYDGISYKYASITIGVPVMQFERMLGKLRGLAVQVLDETASGDDVTNQFVDLQSQVANLEATRERIKSFLDQAKTVDEALRINQELSNIEAQIEQIKGQMNYLQDRSAYSTITINFEPKLPEVVSTPTPTPMPTATPKAWVPAETFNNAKESLSYAYQGIGKFLIWVFVFFVPIFAPPVLILWGLWKLIVRKPKKPIQ